MIIRSPMCLETVFGFPEEVEKILARFINFSNAAHTTKLDICVNLHIAYVEKDTLTPIEWHVATRGFKPLK